MHAFKNAENIFSLLTCVHEDKKLYCQMSRPVAEYGPDDDHVSEQTSESRGLILDQQRSDQATGVVRPDHCLISMYALFQVRSQQ